MADERGVEMNLILSREDKRESMEWTFIVTGAAGRVQ